MPNITEQDSNFDGLEKMSTLELLTNINREDQTVAHSVQKVIPEIEKLVDAMHKKLEDGGRVFYIGSGTSGRLGVVDASECPPTFGVSHDVVVGIIAGGDAAIRKAVEMAEDSHTQAWNDLNKHNVSLKDIVIGIAASGSTPYVFHGLAACQKAGITTGSIACNPQAKISDVADFSIECPVGPEFVTGSTRMKSGTAQKLILNMISTSVMIKWGKVKGNKMIDMQLSNVKLVERGTRMISDQLKISKEIAKELLLKHGSVRTAIAAYKS